MGLKGIPPIISPDLLTVLHSMGHGDEIVFADVHFPTSSICREGPIEVRADGHTIPQLLEAVLQLFPLDTFVPESAILMDTSPAPPIWDEYREVIKNSGEREGPFLMIQRFNFYERAKKAYAVVHTGELNTYANIILVKGLVDYAA